MAIFVIMEKKNLLMFTGAGFSQAYLKNGNDILSSSFFLNVIIQDALFKHWYERIYGSELPISMLTIQKLALRIWLLLSDRTVYSNAVYPPNFETVFYVLNGLCQAQNLKMSPNDPPKDHHTFLLSNLFSTVKPDWDIKFSLDDFYRFKNFILAIVSQFNADYDSLKKLSLFINTLKEEYNIKHFTLNYDDLFIRILDYGKNVIGTSYQHLSSDWNFGHDTYQLTPSRIFYCSEKTPHCSLHVHGSVNYSIGFHTLKFHINKEDALQERNKLSSYITEELPPGEVRDWVPLIVGYEKDKILNVEPYSSIHLRMSQDLFVADEILILGYSLSDEHINKWLIKYPTPIDKPYATQPLKVKRIKIVDFKISENEIKDFIARFLTVARQTGDQAVGAYQHLKAERFSDTVWFIQYDDFYLEFDFGGVDSFVDYFITNKSLFRSQARTQSLED